MRKLLYSVLIVLIVAAMYGFQQRYTQKAEQLINLYIQQAAPAFVIGYEEISTKLNGEITLSNVKFRRSGSDVEQRVETLTINDLDTQNSPPHYATLTLSGLKPTVKTAAHSEQLSLQSLGYENLNLDLTLGYEYEELDRQIRLNLGASANQLADVDATLAVVNFDLQQLNYYLHDPRPLFFSQGSINFQDHSLLERIYDLRGQQLGLTREQIEQKIIQSYKKKVEAAENSGRLQLAEFLAIYSDFLVEPGELLLSAEPSKPVRIIDIIATKDQNKLLNLLNVSLKNSE